MNPVVKTRSDYHDLKSSIYPAKAVAISPVRWLIPIICLGLGFAGGLLYTKKDPFLARQMVVLADSGKKREGTASPPQKSQAGKLNSSKA